MYINGKYILISIECDEYITARKRDLYIIMNYPDEHYKLNFTWEEEDIKNWKTTFGF